VLNAANEEAVAAFCAGRIPFLAIGGVVENTRALCPATADWDLESVLDADRRARETAGGLIARMESEG